MCEDYVRLEKLCEAPLPRRYPSEYSIQGADPEVAAEDVAASERSRIALGDGSLLNLRDVLEADVGIRTFQMKLPSMVVGMFAITDAVGACITVNSSHPLEKRRASLAQEYGHFLTSRYRSEITLEQRYERRPAAERFAEAFARAFLVPAPGLRRRFLDLERARSKGVTHGDLCRLAHFFAVSVEMTTQRLEELRLIPTGTWDRLQLEGFRVREAQRFLGIEAPPPDDDVFPSRFVALAAEAWQRGDLSEGQVARILRTDRLGVRERVRELELLPSRIPEGVRRASNGGKASEVDRQGHPGYDLASVRQVPVPAANRGGPRLARVPAGVLRAFVQPGLASSPETVVGLTARGEQIRVEPGRRVPPQVSSPPPVS